MNKKIDWKFWAFYGFIIIYSVILLFLAYKLNIWEDEGYTLNTTSNTLGTVIRQSYYFEGQPPLYFLLMRIWRYFNSGIFFARLLSLIFVGLSAVYFYRSVRFISGLELSRWIVILFLLNPFTVWAGLEIRLYSFVLFISTVIIYQFFRYYFENTSKNLYIFLLFCLAGAYTQYFFVLEIFALGLSMWVFKGWNSFFKLSLYLIPVVILFIPNLYFLTNEVKIGQVGGTVSAGLSSVLHSPQSLVLGLEMIPINIWVNRVSRLILAIVLLCAYYKIYKKESSGTFLKNINIIIFTTAITFLLYLVLIPVLRLGFTARYIVLMLPLFMLIFMLCKVYNPLARYAIFTGIALFYIYIFCIEYQNPIKRYDYYTAAKFIRKIEFPEEPILLYSKILLPAFSYYYTGPNSLNSLPAYKYDDKYYNENIVDTIELKQALQKIDSPTKSYLLMTGPIEGFRDPIYMDQRMFDRCLESNFNITLDTFFLGENKNYTLEVRRLEIKNK